MSRREPFSQMDLAVRKAKAKTPVFTPAKWDELLRGLEIKPKHEGALIEDIQTVLRMELDRRQAAKEERPAALVAAYAVPVVAFKAFVEVLQAAPASVRMEVQRAMGLADVEEALAGGYALLGAMEARVEGHNPKTAPHALGHLAATVAGACIGHVGKGEVFDLTYKILTRAGLANETQADADTISEAVRETLRRLAK